MVCDICSDLRCGTLIPEHFYTTLYFACFLADKPATPAQTKEHRGAVLDLIEMYLKGESEAI